MPARAWLAATLLATAAAAFVSAQGVPAPSFDARYGLSEGVDLGALLDRPRLLSQSFSDETDAASGAKIVDCAVEGEGLFRLDAARLSSLIEDQEGQVAWAPHVLAVRVCERGGGRIVAEKDTGARFLGLGLDFKTRIELCRDELEGGAIGYRGRLLASLDGRLAYYYNSWYLRPVELRGEKLLYLRLYARTGLLAPGSLEASVFKKRSGPELLDLMRAAVSAAGKGK